MASQQQRAVTAFLKGGEQVRLADVVGLLPEYLPGGIDLQHPEVGSLAVGGVLVSGGRGRGVSCQQEIPVPGLQYRLELVVALAPVGFLPFDPAFRVELYHPVVRHAVALLGLVSGFRRVRGASQQVPAVARLHGAPELVGILPPENPLPFNFPFGIELYGPVVQAAEPRLGFPERVGLSCGKLLAFGRT